MSVPGNGRYGVWSGNERGYKARPGYCLEEVWPTYQWVPKQCSRKAKRGGLCEQHAKDYERRGEPLPLQQQGEVVSE